MNKGKVYLIPSFLGEEPDLNSLSGSGISIAKELRFIVAENAKHARRFLKQIGIEIPLQEVDVKELNEHTDPKEINPLLEPARNGHDIGIISEAGCPGIADPGAALVKIAHQEGIKVIPLPGPSSILLALMASGMNGQAFTFNGYLPKDSGLRQKKIREMEKLAQQGITQLFMDTPYRNNHVLEDLIKSCQPDTKLLIAANITLPGELIRTQKIAAWKKQKPDLHKQPCIFGIGS